MAGLLKPIVFLVSIFAAATCWLYFLSTQFDSKDFVVHFPQNFEDLKSLSSMLKSYQEDHFKLVILLFVSAYIYKQTFAIPGSVFMNILGGALLGTWTSFPLVCFLSAVGASCCYLLSKYFGSQLVKRKFPEKVRSFQSKVKENEDRLFFFLLSARLFPMSPNWFLNITSPIIGVPIHLFFVSVFIGLMPYNFICVQTGSILASVKSMDDVFSMSTFIGMLLVAVVALLPGILLRSYTKVPPSKTKV
uniref:transmembrane protein 41A-A-like n=1 Tax=Ciona intestinalis TaxID=7719 RepID=UPI000180D34D|nr:transmembrane protein 41A-A-like [Ciona intestinalis]|eukprot:XP_002128025.1 transmembrane protein 41A-A-like [Ciona intestinalis]